MRKILLTIRQNQTLIRWIICTAMSFCAVDRRDVEFGLIGTRSTWSFNHASIVGLVRLFCSIDSRSSKMGSNSDWMKIWEWEWSIDGKRNECRYAKAVHVDAAEEHQKTNIYMVEVTFGRTQKKDRLDKRHFSASMFPPAHRAIDKAKREKQEVSSFIVIFTVAI